MQTHRHSLSLFLTHTHRHSHTDTHTHLHIHVSKCVYKERNEREKERERKEKRERDVERGGTPFLVLVFILINVSMNYFPGTLLVLIPAYHQYHCMRIYGLEVKNSCPFACYSMLTPAVFVRS